MHLYKTGQWNFVRRRPKRCGGLKGLRGFTSFLAVMLSFIIPEVDKTGFNHHDCRINDLPASEHVPIRVEVC